MDGRAELERWIAAGGHWTVLADHGDHVSVGLFTCDGGEEMGRVEVSLDELPDAPT